jgi:D-inositol-3-phosphate glycosyltransferase
LYQHLPEFVGGIREYARANGLHYDLIHAHYWLSGVAARSLRSTWGRPYAMMFHTLGMMKNRIAQTAAERESELRINSEHDLLTDADRVIVATPAEQAQIQWLYRVSAVPAEVIPPGVDLSMFFPRPAAEARRSLGLPLDRSLLLFVGRIEPLKGLDTLLRALAIVRDRGVCRCQDLSLAIIGGDPNLPLERQSEEMARMQALRQELDLGEIVTFLGKQGQDELPDYYAAADCVIMPSHYESFGMVALEAMACGRPVIASEVGGLAFLIKDGETGYHVPDRDPTALADRICEQVTDPIRREQLGRQAAAAAQAYAWDIIARRVVRVYEDLLSHGA